MGARGPAHIPSALNELHGNPSKRPRNANEPKPCPVLPDPPKHLSKAAKKEWKSISEQLYRLNLLTEVDVNALAMYCESWASYLTAVAYVQENGSFFTTAQGYMQTHPMATEVKAQAALLLKLAAQFGLTPAARARLSVSGPEKKESKWDFIKDDGEQLG